MMLWLSFVIAFAGFSALAMARHHRALLDTAPAPVARRMLSIGGYGLILLALWPAVMACDLAIGLIAWSGLLTPAALTVIALLMRAPGRKRNAGS